MRSTPYWLDTSTPGPDRSTTPVEGSVDVAVVGAGLTGLSTALHLARRGVSVAVLEADRVAAGASGRNGGMAAPGVTIPFIRAVRRYGHETASRWQWLYAEAIDTVERVAAEEEIDCDFRRSGKLTLAWKPSHLDALRSGHDALREIGYDTTVLGREELVTEIDSPAYHGAVLDPRGASLHVGRFTRGLAEAAVRRGAALHERAAVTALHRDGGGHRVVTTRGTLRAGQVLLATSGHTRRPFRWWQVRVAPVGSFIVVTEPLGAEVAETLLPRRRTASDTKNLLYYFRLTDDHRLLFGGRARFAMSTPESDARSGRILAEAMAEVFPSLRGVGIDYCWGGLVDMTLDRMVHAGEHDGVHHSLGYCGHGVQMATHMGGVMAEVLTGSPETNPWRDLRFRRIPGHVGPPWFLPFAGAYYKAMDVIR